MAVYKDGDKWRVIYRYTNWKGERKQRQKRGFATKREAQAWEREVMLKSECEECCEGDSAERVGICVNVCGVGKTAPHF